MRARLGDQVRLVGRRLSGDTVRPGGTLAVELNWVADAAPGDLRGFVQLIAPDGRLVARSRMASPAAVTRPQRAGRPARPWLIAAVSRCRMAWRPATTP